MNKKFYRVRKQKSAFSFFNFPWNDVEKLFVLKKCGKKGEGEGMGNKEEVEEMWVFWDH
jgi:hypothetical protein